MRIGISGVFSVKVFRKGSLIKHVKTGNSLTSRGAFELLSRLFIIVGNGSNADFFGGPVSDFQGVNGLSISPIKEANFVTLDRADRIQYYFTNNLPNGALGDNRQWEAEALFETVDWGSTSAPPDLGNDYPPLIGVGSGLPSPFITQTTFTYELQPGDVEWRGFYIRHRAIAAGDNRQVEAVIASAALASSLSISSGDTVRVSWTIKLTPTFP